MIVREKQHTITLIPQHNHGILAGEFARHWRAEWFIGGARREDVEYAASEHDRCWVELDEHPIWNDGKHSVFSFMNYPLYPKLTYYRKGIEETALHNRYAALLCSMHFAALLDPEPHPAIQQFVARERRFQEELQRVLGLDGEALHELQFHLQVLQFCDHLSLYVCLNEPGAAKEAEHPWYQQGITGSEHFAFTAGKRIMTRWLDERTIALEPFPFQAPFTAALRCKDADRSLIREQGVAKAYMQTAWSEQRFRFVQI